MAKCLIPCTESNTHMQSIGILIILIIHCCLFPPFIHRSSERRTMKHVKSVCVHLVERSRPQSLQYFICTNVTSYKTTFIIIAIVVVFSYIAKTRPCPTQCCAKPNRKLELYSTYKRCTIFFRCSPLSTYIIHLNAMNHTQNIQKKQNRSAAKNS